MGISLGGFLLNPLKAFGWGSFDGIANTHQLIVQAAMGLLHMEPAMQFNLFPAEKDITSWDWTRGIYGKGPDVGGASNFSDHYYNPRIEKGNGPNAAATQFQNLILKLRQSVNDETTAKCASWAAHFLNDMHVPYHVIGIPGREAYSHRYSMNGYLTLDESGPSILNGRSKVQPHPGWGKEQNFLYSLDQYIKGHRSDDGKVGDVDWYDPWYANSVGIEKTKVVFGSHSKWEYLAHKGWNPQEANTIYKKLIEKFYYDPQWPNYKRPLTQNPMSFAGQKAKEFALRCAKETRLNLLFYYGYPTNAICRAIRSTFTLYRSALTSIRIDSINYARAEGGQYKITCKLHNTHQYEDFQAVDVRLHWREKGGRWKIDEVIRLNEDLRPTNYVDVWWYIPLRSNKKVEIVCDVNGYYSKTPDLGFREKKLTFITNQHYQDPEPERLPEPQRPQATPSRNPVYCGIWKVNRTCIQEENIKNKKEYLGKTYTREWTLYPYDGGKTIKISESGNGRTFVEFKKPGSYGSTYTVTHTFQNEPRYKIRKNIIKLSVSKNNFSGTWKLIESYKSSGRKVGSRTYRITGVSKIKSYD